MSMQPGSIDADGLARTTDGKLYVTLGSGSTIDSPTFTGTTTLTTGVYTTTFSASNPFNIAAASGQSPNIRLAQTGVANWTITNVATTGVLAIAGSTSVTISAVLTAASGTATPAGGSSSAALLLGTTAGFGVYYGSGAPTVSAAQGSIYLRSDGSSTSTRLYVNTNGSTTWTNVTTAA